MNDKKLVIRLKRGNVDAFKELYHKSVQNLYAFTLRTAKVPVLAEDIVHDVFVKLWVNRHQIDPEQSFQGYLFTIARNHFLNFIKRKAHEKEIIDRMIRDTAPAHDNYRKNNPDRARRD